MPRKLTHDVVRVISALGAVFCLLLLSHAATAAVQFSDFAFTGGSDGNTPQGALLQDSHGNLFGETQAGGTAGAGNTFVLSSNGASFALLHSFTGSGADGIGPAGGLRNLNFDFQGPGPDLGVTIEGGTFGLGTVFATNTLGSTITLHSFAGGADGSNPTGRLIRVGGSTYYGTTSAGGSVNEDGIVFRISTSGAYQILHVFSGPDGAGPTEGLAIGSDGNLYGTTSGGGLFGNGVIYRIHPSGAFQVIYNFTGGNDGASPLDALEPDCSGNLYGTTSSGGAFGGGTIFRITLLGALTTLYAFPTDINGNFPNGANPVVGLARVNSVEEECGDTQLFRNGFASRTYLYQRAPSSSYVRGSSSVLYGVTPSGGANNLGVVFSFNVATRNYTVLWAFSGPEGANPNGKLLTSPDGNIYGVTAAGGPSGAGVVFKIGGILSSGTPLFTPKRRVLR